MKKKIQQKWTLGINTKGWPTIFLPDGKERWPDSVWKAGTAQEERKLLHEIVEAHNNFVEIQA